MLNLTFLVSGSRPPQGTVWWAWPLFSDSILPEVLHLVKLEFPLATGACLTQIWKGRERSALKLLPPGETLYQQGKEVKK